MQKVQMLDGIAGLLGILEKTESTNIIGCYSTGTVSKVTNWGFMFGHMSRGKAEDCYHIVDGGQGVGIKEGDCSQVNNSSFLTKTLEEKISLLKVGYTKSSDSSDNFPILIWELES